MWRFVALIVQNVLYYYILFFLLLELSHQENLGSCVQFGSLFCPGCCPCAAGIGPGGEVGQMFAEKCYWLG